MTNVNTSTYWFGCSLSDRYDMAGFKKRVVGSCVLQMICGELSHSGCTHLCNVVIFLHDHMLQFFGRHSFL